MVSNSCELTILMPCLNEAETLGRCLAKAHDYLERSGIAGEVVVADNGSTDGSQAIAEANGARLVTVPIRGYGAALVGGIQAARDVTLDAKLPAGRGPQRGWHHRSGENGQRVVCRTTGLRAGAEHSRNVQAGARREQRGARK